MGTGHSKMPVDSLRRQSNLFSAASSNAMRRSLRRVQQMHPLDSSTGLSPFGDRATYPLRTIEESTLTSLMSLKMTALFCLRGYSVCIEECCFARAKKAVKHGKGKFF